MSYIPLAKVTVQLSRDSVRFYNPTGGNTYTVVEREGDAWCNNFNLTQLLDRITEAYPEDSVFDIADFCYHWAVDQQYNKILSDDPLEAYKQVREYLYNSTNKGETTMTGAIPCDLNELINKHNKGEVTMDNTKKKVDHFGSGWYTLSLPSVSFNEKVGFRIMRPYNNEGDLSLAGLFNNTMEVIENAIKAHGLNGAAEIEEVPVEYSCCGLGALVVDVMYTKTTGDKLLEFMGLRHELSTRDWGSIKALVSRVMYKQV